MTETEKREQEAPTVVPMNVLELKVKANAVNVLSAANLAKDWFADAVNEAQSETEDAIASVRREIVFVVCFAESYIFEWARDVAGMGEVTKYFVKKDNRWEKLKVRWKEVPLRLFEEGLVKTETEPRIDWGDMGVVTTYRHGLVHGAASIPVGLEDEREKPEPTLNDLNKKGQGWALGVVLDLVKQLHDKTQTPMPDYLKNYFKKH
ncbi:MAG: hypothetical protein SVX38_11130 [Chloroflexota bacterium]|nr:hypothetical protein [Chloroflexota bacterium]